MSFVTRPDYTDMTEAYEYSVVHLEFRTGNLPRVCAFCAERPGGARSGSTLRRAPTWR
jgi:hypothetical protein